MSAARSRPRRRRRGRPESTLAVFADLAKDLGGLGVDVGRAVFLERGQPLVDGQVGALVLDDDEYRVVRQILGSACHGDSVRRGPYGPLGVLLERLERMFLRERMGIEVPVDRTPNIRHIWLEERVRRIGGRSVRRRCRAGMTKTRTDARRHPARYAPVLRSMTIETSRIAQRLDAVRQSLDRVEPSEFAAAVADGALVVDIRPVSNRHEEGGLPEAVVVERIHLEWRLDPTSPHRIPEAMPGRRVVIVCNEGHSSSLAAQSLRTLGVDATDLVGGFRALPGVALPNGSTAKGSLVTRETESHGSGRCECDGGERLDFG